MISPPALRTVIISKALSLSASARTESAATMKESSVPLIQKIEPAEAGRWRVAFGPAARSRPANQRAAR